MSIEQIIFPAIITAVQPVPVYQLHAPQEDDLHPIRTPYIIFARAASMWSQWDTTCSANTDICDIIFQTDVYANTLIEARRLAQIIRRVFTNLPQSGSIDAEFDIWEDDMRVYRVSSTFTVTDDDPIIL